MRGPSWSRPLKGQEFSAARDYWESRPSGSSLVDRLARRALVVDTTTGQVLSVGLEQRGGQLELPNERGLRERLLNDPLFRQMSERNDTSVDGLLASGYHQVVRGAAGATAKALALMSTKEFAQGLRLVGGLAEMVQGVVFLVTPEPTGLTKVAGIVLLLHGLDTAAAAAARSGDSGAEQPTLTEATAWVTGDKELARVVGKVGDGAIPIIATAGGALAAELGEAGAVSRAIAEAMPETKIARGVGQSVFGGNISPTTDGLLDLGGAGELSINAPAASSSRALTIGAKVKLRINASNYTAAERQMIQAAIDQSNVRIASGAEKSIVGEKVPFSSYQSRRFVRGYWFSGV